MCFKSAAPVSSITGRGLINGGAKIVPLRQALRHCRGCRADISSAPAHHTMCPQCYHGSMMYHRIRQYLAVCS